MDLDSVLSGPKEALRESWIRSVGADSLPGVQFTEPVGDPGLFGPDSAIWHVHSDVACLVGGLSGLLLGALHQPTMHGTNQHSSYSDDPLARLGRTASFVNAMTFGSLPVIERTCDMVKKMHKQVNGAMPDGREYDANDDDQLIWTGMTQAHSVMRAHLRYHPSPLSGTRIDEYYSQYAEFAKHLGATKPIPQTRAEVEDYFEQMRPLLTYAEETADLADFFRGRNGHDSASRAGSLVISRAAFDLLPGFAQRLYGTRPRGAVGSLTRRADAQATRQAAKVLLAALRWGLGEPEIKIQARERASGRAPAVTAP